MTFFVAKKHTIVVLAVPIIIGLNISKRQKAFRNNACHGAFLYNLHKEYDKVYSISKY
jgi:hypothetical protein